MEAKKETIRSEDIAQDIFIPASNLPMQMPQKATTMPQTPVKVINEEKYRRATHSKVVNFD